MNSRGVARALSACAALLVSSASFAGEYHYQQTLLCFDCHTMHGSMQHGWAGGTVSTTAVLGGSWLASTNPNTYLLKKANDVQLCLACHDGQTFAPDVMGENTASTSFVRQAGAIPTGIAPYENWKGHNLDGSVQVPGGLQSIKLTCIVCHNKHGENRATNGVPMSAFRNLDSLSYAKGTNDVTKDVYLKSFTIGNIAQNYAYDNVYFNEPADRQTGEIGIQYSYFCKSCHTDFHGKPGANSVVGNGLAETQGIQWIRHPTAFANIGGVTVDSEHSSLARYASRPYRVKTANPTGQWGIEGTAWNTPDAGASPACFSCHKAHGNKNPFSLIYLEGTGPVTEEGDAAGMALGHRSLCAQCHTQ